MLFQGIEQKKVSIYGPTLAVRSQKSNTSGYTTGLMPTSHIIKVDVLSRKGSRCDSIKENLFRSAPEAAYGSSNKISIDYDHMRSLLATLFY